MGLQRPWPCVVGDCRAGVLPTKNQEPGESEATNPQEPSTLDLLRLREGFLGVFGGLLGFCRVIPACRVYRVYRV